MNSNNSKKGPPKGSQFWKLATHTGRSAKYKTNKELLAKCNKYFKWVEENPLLEEKLFHFQGKVTAHQATKMRAMTKQGLCLFLGISDTTWDTYGKGEIGEKADPEREDLSETCKMVDDIIYEQKFTGAAADLLNGNIIGRELGLSEKVDTTLTGNVGIIRLPPKKKVGEPTG